MFSDNEVNVRRYPHFIHRIAPTETFPSRDFMVFNGSLLVFLLFCCYLMLICFCWNVRSQYPGYQTVISSENKDEGKSKETTDTDTAEGEGKETMITIPDYVHIEEV